MKLDIDGNYYDPIGTTPESFEEGIQQLIDQHSSPDYPIFKTRLNKTSTTSGPFEMPDIQLFRLTLISKCIHICVVIVNYRPDAKL